MSKVERKEYQETKIVRTVSPGRGNRGGSAQNLSQFDNNLDYLLDDLQSSVPRSNTYKETRVNNVDSGRSNSLNRVTHLKASNPVTEYTSDDAYNYTLPDGSNVKSYKKESYSYNTSVDRVPPEKLRMQNNINQLDSLLDDLKQVKQSSPINKPGIDPGLVSEPIRTKVIMGKRTVERELHYGDTPPRSRTLERAEREGSVTREIEYIDEGTYGETRPLRYTSPPPQVQTTTLAKQKQVTNVQAYPVEVVETTTPDINPEILASLDPNLLPTGNTKVTTTIKTYTYEIPGSGYKPVASPEPEKYVYSPNQNQTTPSKSFVYTKIENDENIVNYPPYQRPTSPPGSGTTIIKETTRNYQPGYHPDPSHPPNKQTYIYNETTTTKHVNEGHPDDPRRRPPDTHDYPVDPRGHPARPDDPHGHHPPSETYIYETTKTTQNAYPNDPRDHRPVNQEPYHGDPHHPRNATYIIKEVHNTTNTTTQPPYNNEYPPQDHGPTTVIYKHDTHTTNYTTPPPPRQVPPPNTTVIINKTHTNTVDNYDPNRYPPHSGHPNEPYTRGPNDSPYDPNNVNVVYRYTTTHTSNPNNYKGYPPNDESQPLLRPQPFPHDGELGPPKRVDQLMANIGREPPDSPLNQGFSVHEAELMQQKKIDTLKQQKEPNDIQKKDRNLPPTKNITGPPVYYPPGEMFVKKEESGGGAAAAGGGGAWRAEGAMARESGKYKYESESGSKMKTSGGAAVVPLCLPCCCGLPCTII